MTRAAAAAAAPEYSIVPSRSHRNFSTQKKPDVVGCNICGGRLAAVWCSDKCRGAAPAAVSAAAIPPARVLICIVCRWMEWCQQSAAAEGSSRWRGSSSREGHQGQQQQQQQQQGQQQGQKQQQQQQQQQQQGQQQGQQQQQQQQQRAAAAEAESVNEQINIICTRLNYCPNYLGRLMSVLRVVPGGREVKVDTSPRFRRGLGKRGKRQPEIASEGRFPGSRYCVLRLESRPNGLMDVPEPTNDCFVVIW